MSPYVNGYWREPAELGKDHERLYGPDDLATQRCDYCGGQMLRALVEAEPEQTTHPACPDPGPFCRKCSGMDAKWHDRGCPRAPTRRARRR